MNLIVLCGKENDSILRNALLPALERYGGAFYASRKQIFRVTAEEPAFFVFDCEQVPDVFWEKGILLFKNSCDGLETLSLPPGFFSVFESHNHRAAAMLRRSHSHVDTCGMSTRDTLNIASLDYGSAVLSLQRNITTLAGQILEPHDFKVTVCNNASPRQVLAVAMVLLLSGIDSSSGYRI